jgi:hypothetical protein
MHSFLASRYLLAFVLVPLISNQSFANGGSYRSEDRYDPDHIESLPSEILDALIHRCGTPNALHEFAGYTGNLQKVVLHFEHLYCSTGGPFAVRPDAGIKLMFLHAAITGSC